MKKIITLHLNYELWKKMAEIVLKSGFASRTAFIVEAIKEKIERMEKEV